MDSQPTYSGHLLALTVPAWGHLRPLCAFSAKLVRERPGIAITFLMAGDRRKQIEGEIGRYFPDSKVDLGPTGNIRVVNICDDQLLDVLAMSPLIEGFSCYYNDLLNSKPIQCRETRTIFDAIRKPDCVLLDFFLLGVLQHIRSITGKQIPVFAWSTASASFNLRVMGPEEIGGFGDVETKARAQVEVTGGNLEKIIDDFYHPLGGRVIRMPGMPPLYDYEWTSQEASPGIPQNRLFTTAYTFARECDGFLCVSSAAYESGSLDALRSWLAETNRPVYAIGPLVPPGFGDAAGLSSVAKQNEIKSSTNGSEFQAFLDKTLKSHGEHSLIYISFGSYWWPKKNQHAWMLVDILLELNFPFILSHASPNAVVPPRYAEKIKQSGIGLLSTWSPQQLVLNHPVTGWFLTHCGQNSVTESLAQGIPMIAWPLDADQPANAAHLTLNLDVAFEVVEVRTGPGLKPLYRGVQPTGSVEAVAAELRGILERARGPEGARKRHNAETMRHMWKKEWEEGGDALTNFRNFLSDNC